MRISCFVLFGALLLSIVTAETENPNRTEEVTVTEKPNTIHNVSSSPEQRVEVKQGEQSEDSDKPRNVRATGIFSFPFSSADNPWASLGTFDKTPILFEHSLEDKEKSKLVIIEPFLRVKQVQKGFWGWLQKIFSKNKEKKGPGPLIGPIKVPGIGDHVYIRAVEPIGDENVVIHLKTNKHALESPDKEIQLLSPLSLGSTFGSSFGSSFGSFDAVHELPNHSSSFQTVYSPQLSTGDVGNLFDKSPLTASDPFWSTFSSSPVSFPSETENIFTNPSFFRKYSTETEGSERPGSLFKNDESSQQYAAWTHSYGSASANESYGNLEPDHDQQGLFASENNQEVSSAREDIDKVQGVQGGQLEISKDADSLPLYPPLFNGSLEYSNSHNKEQLYVPNDTGNLDSGSHSRFSAYRPGLSAYRTHSEMLVPANTNNSSDEKLEEIYINSDGIREVEAPNLSRDESRGRYQYSKQNYDEDGEQTKSDSSNVENSKKVRIFQSSDYGNYRDKDSNLGNMSNETREVVKQLYATYPWSYRVSKERVVNLKASENEKQDSTEPSVSNSEVQTQSESRKASHQRSRSRSTLNRGSEKDFKIVRSRKRSKGRSRNIKLENQTTENPKLENGNVDKQKSDLQTDTSVGVAEIGISESVNDTKILQTVEQSRVEDNCSKKNNSKCTEEKKKESSAEEMKETLTVDELKKFFIEESKRFEDVLKTVEEESKAIKEESKSVEEELKSTNKESTSVEGSDKEEIKSAKEEIKSAKEEVKSVKEEKLSQSGKTTTVRTLNIDNEGSNDKVYIVTPSNQFTNSTRFDIRSKEPPKKDKGKIRTSNSSVRVEIKKPIIQAPRVSIMDSRFNSKLRNNTNSAKLNSTSKVEISKTTPPTHISRIYAKNRFNDRLKNNLKIPKPKEKEGKEEKVKEENLGKEEEKSVEMTKSPNTMSKEEKQKEQLHMRMSKLFPKARNNKVKNETEVIITIKEESAIKTNAQEAA